MKKIEDTELLDELRNVTKQLGRPPKRDELKLYSKYSENAYKRAFGGFSNALKLIGIKPRLTRNHTRDEAINEMKRLSTELGRIPTVKEFRDLASMSYETLRSLIEPLSMTDFAKECGINNVNVKSESNIIVEQKNKNIEHTSKYTKEDAISEVKRLYKELGRIPSSREFDKLAKMSFFTLRELINHTQWYEFLKECDLPEDEIDKVNKKDIPEEELKDEIIRLQTILGKLPSSYDMKRFGKYSNSTYTNRFGSWSEALIYFGFEGK